MQKTVVIHQPDFVPYIGFFHRFLHADLFVVLDHVQFVHSNRSWTHRDKIKTRQGERWLTVSVKKAPRDTPISQVELSSDNTWRSDSINLLRENYRQAAFFKEIMPYIYALYDSKAVYLVDFNMASIVMLMDLLGIDIPSVKSSTISPIGNKNELLVDILIKVGASHYLSGIGAKDYFDPLPFAQADIAVLWQQFSHPTYPQLHGEFIPNLSVLDLLFNCGIERSQEILRAI